MPTERFKVDRIPQISKLVKFELFATACPCLEYSFRLKGLDILCLNLFFIGTGSFLEWTKKFRGRGAGSVGCAVVKNLEFFCHFHTPRFMHEYFCFVPRAR